MTSSLVAQTADNALSGKKVLIVGMGGLGCPAAVALARAGVGELHLCDDDLVDESNLSRQILYQAEDVGLDKLTMAAQRLTEFGASRIVPHRTRLLPENARDLVNGMDVVIEGADNFATKFLTADACYLESTPVIHGSGIRFVGTALLVSAQGTPCYRCLFEDLLADGNAPNCDSAGVMGPVVGIVGSLMADLALDALGSDFSRAGVIHSFDGKSMRLRAIAFQSRPACRLCGNETTDTITKITRQMYLAPSVSPPTSLGLSSSCYT